VALRASIGTIVCQDKRKMPAKRLKTLWLAYFCANDDMFRKLSVSQQTRRHEMKEKVIAMLKDVANGAGDNYDKIAYKC